MLALLLFALAAEAGSIVQAPVTTVILVRHAEKAPAAAMSNDVPLSDAGVARAKELARVLASTSIDAIYTTNYQRTKQTAAPLAADHHLEPIVAEPAAMANIIRTKHAGQTVVVVGHSNTTPDVIRALGVASPPSIGDSEYDDLFIVTLAPGAAPKLVTLRYGAAAR